MLSPLNKLTRRLLHRRKTQGLTQAQAARQAGVSPSWLCQVETGVRPPSRGLAMALEKVYGLAPGAFTRRIVFARPGRRPLSSLSRAALRAIGRAVMVEFQQAAFDFPTDSRVPRHPWPPTPGQVANVLWPMGLHLGLEAQREVEQLEALRPDDEPFWRLLNRLRFDSWSEKRLLVRAALSGGDLLQVAPQRAGCFARVAHGRTGRDASHTPLPAVLLTRGDLSVLFWIQAPVRTWCTFRRVDFLATVCDGRRKMTVAVEVDRPGKDPEAQHRRRLELGLPVLRVPADRVGDADVVERIVKRLGETLQRA